MNERQSKVFLVGSLSRESTAQEQFYEDPLDCQYTYNFGTVQQLVGTITGSQ